MPSTIPDDEPDPLSTTPKARPSTRPTIELELFDQQNLLSPQDHANITIWSAAIFTQLQATGSVRAKIVDDQRMTQAHQQFSGIDTTTDILTFDFNPIDQTESKTLDTDLIICADQAAKQAIQHQHTTAHEILLYIIHGILHCMGYDDQTTNEFNTIHQREDQLLTNAGIGPLFNPNKASQGTQS